MSKRYCVDIDGTICNHTVGRDYHKAQPWQDRIKVLNKLYDEGNYIIYFTARAMGRFSDQPHTIAAQKAKEVLLKYKELLFKAVRNEDLVMNLETRLQLMELENYMTSTIHSFIHHFYL